MFNFSLPASAFSSSSALKITDQCWTLNLWCRPYFLTHGVSHRSLGHLHVQGNLRTVLVLEVKIINQLVNWHLRPSLPQTALELRRWSGGDPVGGSKCCRPCQRSGLTDCHPLVQTTPTAGVTCDITCIHSLTSSVTLINYQEICIRRKVYADEK